MTDKSSLVLESVLRLFKPAARLLLRHGVSYRAFCIPLKRVFLQAAEEELDSRQMPKTDSALTLLSGVHRRDVRELLRDAAASKAAAARQPKSLASEVVARWMFEPAYRHAVGKQTGKRKGPARPLERGPQPGSFDSLVASVSQDIRPRAMLDELVRLGVAKETEDGVELVADGFVTREGFAELAAFFADNLHDHLAAATANLQGDNNFLEQSIFVDQITSASATQLQKAAVLVWKQAFETVMSQAQERFDADAKQAQPDQRNQRARFGIYFYNTPMDGKDQ
ncbi:MAG: DUF6502 family protein [Burkholderiales bacterium]